MDPAGHVRRQHASLFMKQRHAVTLSHDPQLSFGTNRDHLRPGGDELLVSFVHQPTVHIADNQNGRLTLGGPIAGAHGKL